MKYCSDEVSRKIKVLSFSAMVTVVCIHSDPLPLMSNPSAVACRFSHVMSFLKLWAVPFFFVVAGFFFGRYLDVNVDFSYGRLIKNKLRGLVLPYLLWGGIYGAVLSLPLIVMGNRSLGKLWFTGSVFDADGALNVVNRMFGLWGGAPANGALWFVRMLIVFFLLAPVWALLYRRMSWALLPMSLGLIAVPPTDYGTLSACGMSFYFRFSAVGYMLLGMCVSRYRWEEAKPNAVLTCLLSVGIGAAGFADGSLLMKRIWELAWMICVWRLYDFVVLPDRFLNAAICSLTFWIYCMHHWITAYVGAAFRIVLGRGEASYWLQIVGIPVITILLCFGVARFLNRFAPRTFAVLNGGRK